MVPARKQLCLVISLIVIASCSTKLTPKQRVLWGLNVYQAQYNLYIDQILKPETKAEDRARFSADPSLITSSDMKSDISNDQWKVLRVKKDVLVELKPLVVMAAGLVETGQVPTADIQDEMVRLLNRLIEIGD